MGEQLKRKIQDSYQDRYVETHTGDINETRELCGLPPIKPKERHCLKCDIKFTSYSPGNRMCSSCSRNGDWLPAVNIHFRG